MDTFESAGPLTSFGQGAGDDQSFLDFFQQQQQQDQQQGGMLPLDVHLPTPSRGATDAVERGLAPSQAAGQGNGGDNFGKVHDGNAEERPSVGEGSNHKTSLGAQHTGTWMQATDNTRAAQVQGVQGELSSLTPPTYSELSSSSSGPGQSTPPSSLHLDSLRQRQPDAAPPTNEVLTPSQQALSRSGSSSSLSQQQQSTASKIASHQTLQPHSTPIRHNSLPLGHPQQSHLLSQRQAAAASGSRQMTTGATLGNGHGHGDGNLMAPPTMTLSPSKEGFSSPLGPERSSGSALSRQPASPLRMSLPFAASPESTNMMSSPTFMKGEEEQRSGQIVPSQGSPFGQQGQGSIGPGSYNGNDAQGAASTKFVHKLFRMVSDSEYQHLISWNANGTSVVVTNFDDFAKEVLGKHFKHSNFSSFIRQLNMYGFYKVNKTPRGHRHSVDTQVWEFSHPKFLRGRPDLLDDIRRKALDSEHARVEARDLQYSVSVSHMQLRQQVDEQQFRLEELFELNMAMRQNVLGLRDTLAGVLDWIKNNHGGHLPFENRIQALEMPPTPIFPGFLAERPPPWVHSPNSAGPGGSALFAPGPGGVGDLSGDGPSIFVTEPGFGQQSPAQPPPHDVFGMSGLGSVSPLGPGSRRVSSGSQASERMDGTGMRNQSIGPPRMTINTAIAANPGLGVMGLPGEMQMAVNTPLPPSPGVAMHPLPGTGPPGTPFTLDAASPFAQSPSLAAFPQQQPQPGSGYFMTQGPLNGAGMPINHMGHSPQSMLSGSAVSDDDGSVMLMGPNAKAMRTPLKRTASNSGQPLIHSPSQQQHMEMAAMNMQKRKLPGA